MVTDVFKIFRAYVCACVREKFQNISVPSVTCWENRKGSTPDGVTRNVVRKVLVFSQNKHSSTLESRRSSKRNFISIGSEDTPYLEPG